jgi:dipeptidyl aminopeptidase/acylaminoacyl peptidase
MPNEPYRAFYHLRIAIVYVVVMAGSIGLGALVASSPLLPSAWAPTAPPISGLAPVTGAATPPSLTIPELQNRSYTSAPLVVDQDYGQQPGGYDLQRVHYDSEGSTVYALLATPDSLPPPGGYPAIVYAHGALDPPTKYQTDGPTIPNFISYYASHGFVVAKPDFRGYAQSGGAPESDYYTSDDTVDVLNLLASLQLNPNINADQFGLIGWSLGGEVALKAAVVDPSIKAIVIMAGVTAPLTQLALNPPYSEISGAYSPGPAQVLVKRYGFPTASSAFWRQMSPINYVSQLSAAVSMYHCADDTQVPKLYSDQLYARLRQAGKSVSYDQCITGGHDFAGLANQGIVAQTADFFKSRF